MMNCNHNCGGQVRMPGLAQPPCPPRQPNMNQRPVNPESSCGCGANTVLSSAFDQNNLKFPVGMGYVPWQSWETPYPLAQALNRGTIFQALDLPFMMGRCRR